MFFFYLFLKCTDDSLDVSWRRLSADRKCFRSDALSVKIGNVKIAPVHAVQWNRHTLASFDNVWWINVFLICSYFI